MQFRKYQHIEKFGTRDVKGIKQGVCYVFPKVDGTNASVWLGDDGKIHAGSRNRELTIEEDNFGFYKHILEQANIKNFLFNNPELRLYGEWLVPHTLKTYRDDAWRTFYVFDVTKESGPDEDREYLPYPEYQPLLEKYNIEYLPPICKIEKPTKQNLINQIDKTGDYLIKDEADYGEGIVIKNYDFENDYGHTKWAKMVTSRFKENHSKSQINEMESSTTVEEKIVDEYVDEALVDKNLTRVKNNHDGWKSEFIPELFGRVYNDLVNECIWDAIKKFNKPTVDFGDLKGDMIYKIKRLKPELF